MHERGEAESIPSQTMIKETDLVAAKSNLIFGHADALSTAAAAVSLVPAHLRRRREHSGMLTMRGQQAHAAFISQVIRGRPANYDRIAMQKLQVRRVLFPDGLVVNAHICCPYRRLLLLRTSFRPSENTSCPCSRPTPPSLVFQPRRRKRPMFIGTLQSKGTVSKDARARRSICAGANPCGPL